MGGLLNGGGKTVKPPPPPPPLPIPEVDIEVEDIARRRRPRGRRETFLTGALIPEVSGKGTLG
jgi:hypothetical protein